MKNIYLILVFFLWIYPVAATEFSVYEANYPGVKDYNVNIDEVQLEIIPRGIYAEMNLTLTISYDFQSWFFKNYNELEFLWQFALPEDAIMHEFWLWEEDTVLSAAVLDKWTAELLFSDVSTPVRNPGLLTQSMPKYDGTVDYELKLYPVIRDQPKKFKVQYLVPARPSVDALRVWLPTTQLLSSKTPAIDTLQLIYRYEDDFIEPGIIGTTPLNSQHLAQEKTWKMTIPLDFDQFVEFVYPAPIKDDFYFSTWNENGENFYHLAVFPPEAPQVTSSRNILVAIDFNRLNTDGLDGEFLLLFLKETIQQALSPEDSINIIVAYDDLVWGADEWISATEENIDYLFSKVMQRSFPAYSYFQPLISEAAEFINRQYKIADVFFFTNTDEISLGTSNKEALASEIIGMFKKGTRLHFVDLENQSSLVYQYYNLDYFYQYYYETQLQSFYGTMTYETGGNLFFLRYHSIKTILNALFYEQISHFENVEIQLRFADGYAHSKHKLSLHEGYYPLQFPIMEVGKFTGSLPIEVKVLGKIRREKVEKEFTIHESDVVVGSARIATSWYGDQIQNLVHYPSNPLTINDIIDLSIDQHILSPYSGFIVFSKEYTLDDENEDDGDDNGGDDEDPADNPSTSVNSENEMTQVDDFELGAYPNPFNARVSIKLTYPSNFNADDYQLAIYNVLGQQVMKFDLNSGSGAQRVFIWNARDETGMPVSTGVYFAILQGPGIRKTLKLLYLQ